MVFVWLLQNKDKFGYLNPVMGKFGWHTTLIDGSLKSHRWLSIHVIELFSLSITIPELWGEMCTARLFSQGVDLFALRFYPVVPINHPWRRKTRDTGLPTVNRIRLCSLVLTQYRSVTDRQMEGHICHSINSACTVPSKDSMWAAKLFLILLFHALVSWAATDRLGATISM